jgi:hypothetical protein
VEEQYFRAARERLATEAGRERRAGSIRAQLI